MNILDFKKYKKQKKKITMLTCYDHWSAKILNESKVDVILVGDSLAMVMHGHSTTLPATVDLMALHTEAVVRGAPDKFVVADMPFLSFRMDLNENMKAVAALMRTGAQAVKLEGVAGNESLIRYVTESGVPVMGHLGLTPQSIHQLGGFRVQAKEKSHGDLLLEQALELQELGCFSLVLECVPGAVAERVSLALEIPTIGIGAGPETDGQVLVLQDMLGVQKDFKPKFLRQYMNGHDSILTAVNSFVEDVDARQFPSAEESYS